MYIIVVGGGKVGYYLSKSLLEEENEVLVIEEKPERCARINDELGVNILIGDGSDVHCLEQAGVKRADVVIAVTGEDEDNLVICQIAKQKFQVPRTIARLNNPKNGKIFRELGIDVTVSSTELILSQIEQEIPAHSLVSLLTLSNIGVNFIEVSIPGSSPVLGKPLRELRFPSGCSVGIVIRNGKDIIIPNGGTVLQKDDKVIVFATDACKADMHHILIGRTDQLIG